MGSSVQHGFLVKGETGLINWRVLLKDECLPGRGTQLHRTIGPFLKKNLAIWVVFDKRGYGGVLEQMITKLAFGELGKIWAGGHCLCLLHLGDEGFATQLEVSSSLCL